ncbi:MAG: DUF4255 domain-containing protein [Chloroflexi bacterium]|nr:DUF4255 domain-containing protein [Chloroflexota bacterium]MCI0575348.1 DUF4255 domain-containing protein [Chloroflexota bacterium]MCI0645822.1 DUF4255 domain-containing protein [Chloroflexota bacterium]MCI0730966.1 DUF4255 domain-containing protein [Chloroflexota bacterium]
MSNEFAIAAVTRTLRNLLNQIISADFSGLPADTTPSAEIMVTTLPLDKVRDNGTENKNQINLFLYHTAPNTAWRNMDIPGRVRPGETAQPPLALNLYYLVTAYGENNNELVGHLLLGTAMAILHDHAVLGRAEIETALALSDVHKQVERVRLTPQSIPIDEVSKLWTGFQAEYRLSAAYEASVVLIESKRPAVTPLPVLRRGSEDRGAYVLSFPSPTLYGVRFPNDKASAEPGDVLTLSGNSLAGGDLTVRFRSNRLADPLELSPLPGDVTSELKVKLPGTADDPQVPAKWPAGFYTLSVVVKRPGLPAWTSNELSFALAPQVTSVSPGTMAQSSLPATLTLTCRPQVRPEQPAVLLFGGREIAADTITTPADPTAQTTLTFTVDGVLPGEHVVRLRVDGVDSIPVIFSASEPPEFDDNQKVTITP